MWLKFCADFEFHVGNFPSALILVVLDTYFSGGKSPPSKNHQFCAQIFPKNRRRVVGYQFSDPRNMISAKFYPGKTFLLAYYSSRVGFFHLHFLTQSQFHWWSLKADNQKIFFYYFSTHQVVSISHNTVIFSYGIIVQKSIIFTENFNIPKYSLPRAEKVPKTSRQMVGCQKLFFYYFSTHNSTLVRKNIREKMPSGGF